MNVSRTSSKGLLYSSLFGIAVSSALYLYTRKVKRKHKNLGDDDEETIQKILPSFEKASKVAKSELKHVSQNDQLMMYGLYKQAKFGNAILNMKSPPSKLNMVAFAKYDAWTKFQDMPRDFAMMKYIEVVDHFKSQNNSTKYDLGSSSSSNSKSRNIANNSLFGDDNNDDIIYDDDDNDFDEESSDDDENDDDNGKTTESSFSFGVQQSTLSHSADSRDSDINEKSTILHAATEGNTTLIQQCLEKENCVNDNDENGQSALHLAADKGFIECVNILLEAGADPNAADISGISVLEAAVIGGNIDVIQMLLHAGSDPDQEDMDGETPRSCAEDDDDEDIRILLRNAPKVQKRQ
jgi:ankyrin repeat protein